MGRFWEFVRKANAPSGRLPLVHATDLFCFRRIRMEARLVPTACEVYGGQKLLYFFYGRPSYRPHAQLDTVTAKALLPVCLVVSREVAQDAVRVMPFDTGAFYRKMMHPPIHEMMELGEFELGLAASAPMRVVDLFYGGERQYYLAKARPSLVSYDEFEDLEVDSYFRLLHHRANTAFDDRVTAIEFQLDKPVDIAGRIEAAILPKPYLDRPGVAEQINGWGGIPSPYNVKEEFVPREIQGAIFDRLTDYLEHGGVF